MDRKKRLHRRNEAIGLSAGIFLLVFFGWSLLLYYVTPSEIIDYIGIENGFLLVFVGGLLGGTSLFFPFPNYLLVFTFGGAGLQPLLLAFFAALGVILGESTSYFVGHSSHMLLSERIDRRVHRVQDWLLTQPHWRIPLLLLVWGTIFPLPNDFILVPLGLLRYPFWRTIIPLGLGNFLFYIGVAFAGHYGFSLFF